MKLKDGVPCDHLGCFNHSTHPCEGCGRVAGRPKPKVELIFSLTVDCPGCEEEIDLTDGEFENLYVDPIFTNEWEALEDEEVECPHCEIKFQIDGVEY